MALLSRRKRVSALAASALGFAMAAPVCSAQDTEKPAKLAKPVKKVSYLGVSTEPVKPVIAAQLGLLEGHGLTVLNVVPDSPSAAVLREFDILLRFDDQKLINRDQMRILLRAKAPGTKVTIAILRKAKPQNVEVTLGERTEQEERKDTWTKDFTVDLTENLKAYNKALKGGSLKVPFDSDKLDTWIEKFEGETRDGIESLFDKGVHNFEYDLGGQQDKMMVKRQDGDHSIEMTREKGKLRVKVVDKSGAVVLEADLSAKDALKDTDPKLKAKIEELRKMAFSSEGRKGRSVRRFLFRDPMKNLPMNPLKGRLPRFAFPFGKGEFNELLDAKLLEDLNEALKELEDLLDKGELEQLGDRLKKLGDRLEQTSKKKARKIRIRSKNLFKDGEDSAFDDVLQYRDGEHGISIFRKDGGRRIEIRDAKGDMIYSAPFDTEDQHKAVPPAVRAKVERLMKRTTVRKKKRHDR